MFSLLVSFENTIYRELEANLSQGCGYKKEVRPACRTVANCSFNLNICVWWVVSFLLWFNMWKLTWIFVYSWVIDRGWSKLCILLSFHNDPVYLTPHSCSTANATSPDSATKEPLMVPLQREQLFLLLKCIVWFEYVCLLCYSSLKVPAYCVLFFFLGGGQSSAQLSIAVAHNVGTNMVTMPIPTHPPQWS